MKTKTLFVALFISFLITSFGFSEETRFPKALVPAKLSSSASIKQMKFKTLSSNLSSIQWLNKSTYHLKLNTPKKRGDTHTINTEVSQSGYIILGFHFEKGAGDKAMTPYKLKLAGWDLIGFILHRRQIWKNLKTNDKELHNIQVRCALFIKHVKKGEKLQFFSSKKVPPFILLPDSKAIQQLHKNSSLKISTDEWKLIEKKRAKYPVQYNGYPQDVLALSCEEPRLNRLKQYAGTLTRELIRQSFLIASRDELGYSTRDDSLLEINNQQKTSGNNPAFHMLNYFDAYQETDKLRIIVYQHLKEGLAVPYQSTDYFPKHRSKPGKLLKYSLPLEELVVFAENLSRTKFRDVVSKHGANSKNNRSAKAFQNKGTVSKEIEQRLDQWNWLFQYIAIRQLHAEIKEQGESPELLGALVRGYANLGSLTEFYSSPAPKVFKARALLYAQRLRIKTKNSPFSQYHWAYALALTGLDLPAQHVLTSVAKIPADTNSPANWQIKPHWVKTLLCFCKYDDKKLRSLTTDNNERRFARYLVMLAMENSEFTRPRLQAANDMLAAQPICLRAKDVVYNSWSQQTSSTHIRLTMSYFQNLLPRLLQEVSDLPKGLEKILNAHTIRLKNQDKTKRPSYKETIQFYAQIITYLDNPQQTNNDKQEASLVLLNQMLKEVFLQHAWWEAANMVKLGNGRANGTVNLYEPLYKTHPLAVRVYSFSSDRNYCKRAIAKYAKNVRQEFVSLNDYVQFIRNDLHRSAWFSHDANRHADILRGDLFKMLNTRKGFYNVDGNTAIVTRRISSISQLPHAAFLSSLHDYKTISSKIPVWKKQYQNYPDFQKRMIEISKWGKNTSQTIAEYNKLIELLPGEQRVLFELSKYKNANGIKQTQKELTEKEVFNNPLVLARISVSPGVVKERVGGKFYPQWLQQATVHKNKLRRLREGYKLLDNEIEFEVTQSGYIMLMYATEKQNGKKAISSKLLKQNGWYSIDPQRGTYNMQQLNGSNRRHQLYLKYVKKGEKHFFAANISTRPFVILPNVKVLYLMKSYSESNITPYEQVLIENRKARLPNEAAGFPVGIVGLTLEEPDMEKIKPYAGALTRELVRQSFLISARDELGLSTRDDSLQELTNSGLKKSGENPLFHMLTYIESEKKVDTLRTILYQNHENGLVVPFQITHKFTGHQSNPGTTNINNMYSTPLWELTIFAEKLSRTKFRDVIKKHSPQPKNKITVKPFHSDGFVSEEIEKQLDEWNWLSQYSVIRSLHYEIQQEGESPQLLGALIRAYANLGSLTEFYSTPASKVFKARALLYAQRLRVKTKTSPFSQYHWAYAVALAGQDISAHHTLQMVKKNPAADDAPPIWKKTPVWAETLSYFCDYNIEELHYLAGERNSQQKMARYFIMLASEISYFQLTRQDATNNMLAVQPDCFRAMDILRQIRSFSVLGPVLDRATTKFRGPLFKELRAVPYLSQELKTQLDSSIERFRNTDEDQRPSLEETMQMYARLIAFMNDPKHTIEDRQEPSLALLHQMTKEVLFQHAWRMVRYEVGMRGTNADEEISLYGPVCKTHHLAACFFGYSSNKQIRLHAKKEYRKNIRRDYQSLMNTVRFHRYDKSRFFDDRGEAIHRIDNTRRDLFLSMYAGTPLLVVEQSFPPLSHRITKVSQLPHAAAILIVQDWKKYKLDQERLNKKYGGYPDIQNQLASYYVKEKKFSEAQAAYEKLVKLVPEKKTYIALADFHKKHGNKKLWLKVMEDYLKETQDFGLEHASINKRIADYFMRDQLYQKALPYAEKAKASGSAWGASVAMECYEGLDQWDKAEEMARFVTDRYNSPVNWLMWCTRTGHGDLKAARAHAEKHFLKGDSATNKRWNGYVRIAYYFMINNQKKLTSEHRLWVNYGHNLNPKYALLASSTAWQIGDIETRDKFLAQAMKKPTAELLELAKKLKGQKKQPITDAMKLEQSYKAFAELLLKKTKLKKTDPEKFNMTEFHKLFLAAPRRASTTMWYHLGVYLDQNGREKEATQYFHWAASTPHSLFEYSNVLAADWLRLHKQKISKSRRYEIDDVMKKEFGYKKPTDPKPKKDQ